MSKLARYKDYVYLSDDEISPVAFDRQIDFENQVWYFVITDCAKLTQEKDTLEQRPFVVTLDILNGDSQFSYEDRYMLYFLCAVTVVVGALTSCNAVLSWDDMVRPDRFSNPLIIVSFSLMLLAAKTFL